MSRSTPLIDRERDWTPQALGWSVSCVLSGAALWFIPGTTTWIDFMLIAHAISGIGLVISVTPYLWFHARRTVGVRRGAVLLAGLLTVPPFIAACWTGAHLVFFGQREAERWILQLHVASASFLIVVAAAHLILHVLLLPRARAGPERGQLSSGIPPATMRAGALGIVLPIALVAISSFAYDAIDGGWPSGPAVEPYEKTYGDHPFRPSQTETLDGGFFDARRIGGSDRCGACHAEIARQWQASVHREAASDAAYVTNIMLLESKKGTSATRYCEGCHAPIALLSGELTRGGKHGGIEGTLANREGVSCLSCHGIESIVHLKGVASYRFAPATDRIFARADFAFVRGVHDWVLRVRPNSHRSEMLRAHLRDSGVCATCHAQFMDTDMNGWGWVKMQDDYSAWLESPYSGRLEDGFSSSEISRCQDCHMPLVAADDPAADSNGMVRSHRFPGANTVLPLLRGDQEQLDATISFLQANRVRITIDPPTRSDARQTQRPVKEDIRGYEEAPYYYYLGETARIRVTATNVGVGHDFPGGTIDIGEAWIEFMAVDAQGSVVHSSGAIDSEDVVDPSAYFYRSLPVDRQGDLVWRHDLFNMIGETMRRVIPAGKSDLVEFSFEIPAWAKSPLTVTAIMRYRKLNARYAKWALGERYLSVPAVDIARNSLTVPVRVRKEAES